MSNSGILKKTLWAGAALIAVGGIVKEARDAWPALQAKLNASACDMTPNCRPHYAEFQWPRTPRNQMPSDALHL